MGPDASSHPVYEHIRSFSCSNHKLFIRAACLSEGFNDLDPVYILNSRIIQLLCFLNRKLISALALIEHQGHKDKPNGRAHKVSKPQPPVNGHDIDEHDYGQ